VANTVAYYDVATVMAVKGFIIEALAFYMSSHFRPKTL
jgi:hypothetical protein